MMTKLNPKMCFIQLSNKPEIHKFLCVIVGLIIMDYNNFTLQCLKPNIVLQILFLFSLVFTEYKMPSVIPEEFGNLGRICFYNNTILYLSK